MDLGRGSDGLCESAANREGRTGWSATSLKRSEWRGCSARAGEENREAANLDFTRQRERADRANCLVE
ncbi:hypothetical protein MA16_Dca029227 [Dendrobium catenatum]|uniref:Uncharacterized protein n=1 Tax=Dendrobium catenatum TaxID=906689 RepID=A0A2I0V9C9_9ASPA|nr:hypothetical protein MA16_Dca029227 [Dendrobium catenatum]